MATAPRSLASGPPLAAITIVDREMKLANGVGRRSRLESTRIAVQSGRRWQFSKRTPGASGHSSLWYHHSLQTPERATC